MRSMTGIGRACVRIPKTGSKIDVEVRSHNHRFLEISVKCPGSLLSYENQIREEVNKVLTRGYVVVSIQMDEETDQYAVDVDESLLRRIVKLRDLIAKKYRISGDLSIDTIIQLPGIVRFKRTEAAGDKVFKTLMSATCKALNRLLRSKSMEGANIKRSIEKSIHKIKMALKRLEVRAPLRRREKKARLEKLLAEAMIKATPKKMAEEILYYVDRLDITEECSRIKSHLKLIARALNTPTPGRRINFLVQELYREANTTAAKAYDAKISELAVSIKEEIEKIREQIQNVE